MVGRGTVLSHTLPAALRTGRRAMTAATGPWALSVVFGGVVVRCAPGTPADDTSAVRLLG